MTLLDIHGQVRPPSPTTAKPATVRVRPTSSLALFETVLGNPLLPALAFGAIFHLIRLGIHLALHGTLAGFLPVRPSHWIAWLPEFVVPYGALWAISAAYRKANQSMHERILEGLERGNEIQKVSILGFAKISEVRDPDTGDHIIRMSHYSRMLAQEMAKHPEYSDYITRTYCDEIFIAAPLHDIGKVGIRDDILKKRGGLTADEFEIMKMHTIIGGDLLHELELKLGWRTFYSLSKEIAYHHHQRFDGTGYPNVLGTTRAMFVEPGIGKPLAGKAIPLSARIVAMADVYDALVSRRCYKEPIPHGQAREMIVAESGRHFDPDLVQAFLRIEPDLIRVCREFSK
jgi:putative two-component system response regulator